MGWPEGSQRRSVARCGCVLFRLWIQEELNSEAPHLQMCEMEVTDCLQSREELDVFVVFGWACDHEGVLLTVGVPAAPGGFMIGLVERGDEVSIGNAPVDEKLLLPLLNVLELVVRGAKWANV